MGRRSLSRAIGLAVCALLAVGCGKSYMDLPPMQFYSLLTSNKKVHVIDVRTPQEYADEHIKGALNLPVADTASTILAVFLLRRQIRQFREEDKKANIKPIL